MMNRELAFVMIVISSGIGAYAAGPPPCKAEQEEYAVIATILQQRNRKMTITEQVTDDPHFASTAGLSSITRRDEVTNYREQMKFIRDGGVVFLQRPKKTVQFPPELIRDYEAKNARVCLWDVNRFKSKQVLTWEVATKFPRDNPDAWWKELHARFGSDASAARVSRVGFDSSGKKSVVHVSEGVAKNGAGGTLYYLEKNGDRWVIKLAQETWTT
jgi:hypothetical protein